jgi:hypothetical protein|nr:hypothetical protein [uncultured Flavobacterium sp.]
MKIKIKNYSIQFIKEIIPVIAGILIALFIDNWNSERKDKAYINQVFSTINSELKESNEDIKSNIPQQKSLIDSLEFYSKNKNVTILDIVMKSKGIYVPSIRINAWKSVSNSKIDLIEYEKVTTLSNIEELKITLNNKTQFLMSFFYSNINETDKNKKQTLKMILLDIIQTERTIEKNIELFVKK